VKHRPSRCARCALDHFPRRQSFWTHHSSCAFWDTIPIRSTALSRWIVTKYGQTLWLRVAN